MKTLIAILFLPLVSLAQNVFDAKPTLKVKITAPFQSLFNKKAKSSIWASMHTIEGTLEVFNEFKHENETYQVQISMRGNMTLNECDFPKLKLKFKKEETTKLRLFNHKSYDLATHCINQPENHINNYVKSKMLAASPHRESFLLGLQPDLGLISPLTRDLVIDYVDTSDPQKIVTGANRNAFIIESTGQILKRTQALYSVVGTKDFVKKLMNINPQDTDMPPQRLFEYAARHSEINNTEVLKFFLLQALIGNMDYYIKTLENVNSSYGFIQLWNVKMIALNPEQWTVYGNDYNLAAVMASEDFKKENFLVSANVAMGYFKQFGSESDRRAAVDFFLAQKTKLYAKAETIKNDPSFKAKYLLYLDHFYELLKDS